METTDLRMSSISLFKTFGSSPKETESPSSSSSSSSSSVSGAGASSVGGSASTATGAGAGAGAGVSSFGSSSFLSFLSCFSAGFLRFFHRLGGG